MNNFSDYAIIAPVTAIVILALFKRVNAFDAFIEGGKRGLATAFEILPSTIALVTSIEMLRASGALDAVSGLLAPLGKLLGIPREILPLGLMRPVSGSASRALFYDSLGRFGADSLIGRCASVIMGAGETTFYTAGVYFAATSVRHTRHTIAAALIADAAVVIAGCFIVTRWF